jgi:hypothetical protein
METDINQFNDDTKKVLLSFPYYEFMGANFNVLRENCIFVYTYIRWYSYSQ